MRYQQHGLIRLAHDAVYAVANRPKRVNVEAAVGLIKNRERGVDDAHLHHFVALLLAAGKTHIYRTLEHVHIHTECARLFARNLEELSAR